MARPLSAYHIVTPIGQRTSARSGGVTHNNHSVMSVAGSEEVKETALEAVEESRG